VLALTAAQRFVSEGPWWLELSRYLPYPLLVAPAVVALLFSIRLGWRWLVAAAATIAAFATLAMGFVWNADPGDDAAVDVRFMTYNVKALLAIERRGGLAALAAEVERHHPDVVVMQDSSPLMRGRDPERPGSMFGLPEVKREAQYVIASRWPLRNCTTARADSAEVQLAFARCTVDRPGGAFEIVDVHFESPRTGLVAARQEGFDGIELWQNNYVGRVAQARALAAVLRTSAHPLVVGGDLNAPDASAAIQALLAIGLRDAFATAGRGWGHTYGHRLRPRFSFLRIDHILVSDDVTVVRAFTGGEEASDHRPVIADLRLPQR
jgi:endonuclease/exonuclease/phosphatase (EEP) superfamily protein YafD